MEAPFVGNEGSGRVYICFALFCYPHPLEIPRSHWIPRPIRVALHPMDLYLCPWQRSPLGPQRKHCRVDGIRQWLHSCLPVGAGFKPMLGNLCKGKCCDTAIRLLAAITSPGVHQKVEATWRPPYFFSDLVLQYTWCFRKNWQLHLFRYMKTLQIVSIYHINLVPWTTTSSMDVRLNNNLPS